MKKLGILLVLLISLGTTSAQSQSDPFVFQLSADHEMEAVLTTSLVWEEDTTEVIELNLTMTDFRVNNSEIGVQVIQIFAFELSGQGELIGQNTTEQTITVNDRSLVYRETLSTPSAADRFYLNVSIFAYPSGGGADETTQLYSFRYPQDDTIIVQRDNLVPLVNLYGFPPASFFQFWLPIYGLFLVGLLTPAIFFGVSKIQERNNKATEKNIATNEEEGS